jgi:hypothetical protein
MERRPSVRRNVPGAKGVIPIAYSRYAARLRRMSECTTIPLDRASESSANTASSSEVR